MLRRVLRKTRIKKGELMPARLPDHVKRMTGTLRQPAKKARRKPAAQTEPTLSAVDQALLTDLQADRLRLRRELEKCGTTYTTRGGFIRPHPASIQLREVEAAIVRLTGRASRSSKPAERGDAPITPAEREWLDAELRREGNYFPDLTDERILLAEYRAGRR
jgi:hypothetical protein